MENKLPIGNIIFVIIVATMFGFAVKFIKTATTVNETINDAKILANQSTARQIQLTIRRDCQLEMIEKGSITKEYTISNGIITPEVEILGDMPNSGIVKVNDDCEVTTLELDFEWSTVKLNSETGDLEATKKD